MQVTKNRKSKLVLVREEENLVWMNYFLKQTDFPFDLLSYDLLSNSRQNPGLGMSPKELASWIKNKGYKSVFFISDQKGMIVDSQAANIFKKDGLDAIAQSLKCAQLGYSKIKSRLFLRAHSFPTPDFFIAKNQTDAIKFSRKIGFPVVIKVAGLSDGRKMTLARSEEDVVNYFYEDAIDEPVIVDKYIVGREVSTIVYSNWGNPIVFPVVAKPKTTYLMAKKSVRKRNYISPFGDLSKMERNIQNLALKVASSFGNQYIFGLDMVIDKDNNPLILECNTRLVGTLRMSMLQTGKNVLASLITNSIIENKSPYVKSLGTVLDMPLENVPKLMSDFIDRGKIAAVESPYRLSVLLESPKQIKAFGIKL